MQVGPFGRSNLVDNLDYVSLMSDMSALLDQTTDPI
jgi:hypothetical protein